MQQETGRYRGPAEIIVGGEVVATVEALMVGQVEVIRSDAFDGVTQDILGSRSWSGRLSGLPVDLLSSQVTLRMPDGRETEAIVIADDGRVTGASDFVF